MVKGVKILCNIQAQFDDGEYYELDSQYSNRLKFGTTNVSMVL